jgi:DNA adenine methylase
MIYKSFKRLLDVQIECLPYEQILKRYDRPTTFFYLDPPYFKKPYYMFNFEERDFAQLAERLLSLKGKFLLSINDHPEIRKVFANFRTEEISFYYSIQKHPARRYTELLIKNY